jgi:rhamnogalacturonyl hydrolase YesR
MWGLMMWAKRGVPGALDCVKGWFEAHVQRDLKLSDAEFAKTYTGHGSRVIRGTYLPFAMYCGFYGMIYPLAELFSQTGDPRAKTTVMEIADALLYRSRRNKFGLVAHDDNWIYDIPDAGFMAILSAMMAAKAEPSQAAALTRHGVTQLRAYIDVFLDRKLGLSKTILGPDGVGKTYWCRAQGWLMWCFISLMRDLPQSHPAFKGFRDDLEVFADGIAKVTDADGAIHAEANKPDTLAETTGTAMVCLSLHESVRRGWLKGESYNPLIQRMWHYVKKYVNDDGGFEKVYYEWALPAEMSVESSKTVKYGPHIGALLWLADEITTN